MPAAVAALVDLAALFFLVVAYMVMRGTLAAWEHTIGGLLQWMHDHLRIPVPIPFHSPVHVNVGAPFGAANNYMVRLLQSGAASCEWAIGVLWHGLAELASWTLATIETAYHDSLRWARWQQNVFVPAFVHAITHPLATAVAALHATTSTVTREVHTVTKIVHTVTRTIEHTTIRVVRQAGAATLPGIQAIPGLVVNWRGLTRRMVRAERRLRKLELTIGAASVLAIAMANVLGVSARCLRSGNVGRVARRLCGLSLRAIEDLLGLLADTFLFTHICSVLDVLVRGLDFVQPEVSAFIGGVEAWACYGDREHPPDTPAPGLSLPSASKVALYLP